MTWYLDLAECDYFGEEVAAKLRAVGWLKTGTTFPTGATDPAHYDKLKTLMREPWQPVIFMGIHPCELCRYEPGALGGKNLFVPGTGFLYVCPELITHYMNAHSYKPPEDFLSALSRCPEMGTREYLRAIMNNGGREIRAHFSAKLNGASE